MANRPAPFDREALAALRAQAVAATEDPKEDASFAAFAEGVAAAFGWLMGEAPHPGLADLLQLED